MKIINTKRKKNRFRITLPKVLLLILFLIGAFYRFRYADTFMTEYDDIGTLALNIRGHQYLINPYLYFYNIASGWTYPPGQYFIFSLLFLPFADLSLQGGKLIAGDMDFLTMHTVARYFVGLCSLMNMLLIWKILNKYFDRGQARASTLLCITLLGLSLFHIAYSYHTGPYVPALTAMLLMITLAWNNTYKSARWISFFVLMALLVHFNYLILIMLPALIISSFYEICRQNNFIYYVKNHLFYNVIGILLFSLLIAHLFLASFFFEKTVYIKSNRGMHGDYLFENGMGEAFMNFWKSSYAIFHNLFNFSYNLVPTLEYLIYIPLFILILIGVLVGIWHLISPKHFKNKKSTNLVTLFLLLFAATWMVLHYFKKVPFHDTRHLIFWTPFYLVFLKLGLDFVLNRWFRGAKKSYLELILLPLVLFAITSNVFFSERQAQFNFDDIKDLIETYKPTTMGMDLATLHPLMLNHSYPDMYINPQTGDDFNDPSMPQYPGFSERPYIYVGQSEPLSPVFIEKLEQVHGKSLVQEFIHAPEKSIYMAPNNTPLNSCRNAKYIYIFE